MSDESQNNVDELALDFLEQWLAAASGDGAPMQEVVHQDPSLRAIERLVTRHQELFRRHSQK